MAQTQITSAASSVQTKPLGRNWTRRLKDTVNSIIADLKRCEVQAGLGTSVSQIPGGGRSVNASVQAGQKPSDGSAIARQPFEIYANAAGVIVMKTSTIDGEEPSQFADGDWPLPAGGYNEVYAHVTINSDGDVTAKVLETGATVPDDTDTEKYDAIGNANTNPEVFTFNNYRFGPVGITVCRDWFSNPATYSVSWT